MNQPVTYNKAVETIKTAILQGQYEAAKGVNRIQLAVYFAIGKYISLNTRKGNGVQAHWRPLANNFEKSCLDCVVLPHQV